MLTVDGEWLAEYIGMLAFTPKHHRQKFTLDIGVALFNLGEANATGLPSCINAAANPLIEASTWITVGLFGSKYAKVVSLHMRSFIFWNVCSWHLFH